MRLAAREEAEDGASTGLRLRRLASDFSAAFHFAALLLFVRAMHGVRHRPGWISDCSRDGAANTDTPSPPSHFALSLVNELLESIVADGRLINSGAAPGCVSCSPAYCLQALGSAFCCGLAFIRSAQYAQESEAALLRPPRMPGSSPLAIAPKDRGPATVRKAKKTLEPLTSSESPPPEIRARGAHWDPVDREK